MVGEIKPYTNAGTYCTWIPMFFPKASKLANSLQITTVDASSFGGQQWEIKDDGPQKRWTKLEIGELVN